MPREGKPVGYNTGIASEFHVLSILHRLGLDATLTLSNRKAVDIVVARAAGDSVTVDVKGLAGSTSWPVDNLKEPRPRHFLVFVCYANKIGNPEFTPETWVIPSTKLAPFVYHSPSGSRKVVQRSKLRKEAERYRNAWKLIAGRTLRALRSKTKTRIGKCNETDRAGAPTPAGPDHNPITAGSKKWLSESIGAPKRQVVRSPKTSQAPIT